MGKAIAILIGECDSPFVPRVAVTLRPYGFAYEHAAWSTFGDAERTAQYNPRSLARPAA